MENRGLRCLFYELPCTIVSWSDGTLVRYYMTGDTEITPEMRRRRDQYQEDSPYESVRIFALDRYDIVVDILRKVKIEH